MDFLLRTELSWREPYEGGSFSRSGIYECVFQAETEEAAREAMKTALEESESAAKKRHKNVIGLAVISVVLTKIVTFEGDLPKSGWVMSWLT